MNLPGDASRLSVLMPAHDEEETIQDCIMEVHRSLDDLGVQHEIVAVNDGSNDSTGEILEEMGTDNDFLHPVSYGRNKGKGGALKHGYSHVDGDLVQFIDADSDIEPRRIKRFLEEMEENGADIVIGSKRHPESGVDYPLKRTILSKGYAALLRVLFGLGVTDTQVGMKLFRREVLDDVMPLILVKRYAFDIEILSLANRKGYEISEAPIDIELEGDDSNLDWTAVARIAWDTAAVFYRLKILRYYQKREEEVSS